MTETPDESCIGRLPPNAQREFAKHTLGIVQANQQLRDVNAVAEMEANILNQTGDGQLASFFRGNADNCRRNVELWTQIADHFEAMGQIVDENS